MADELEEILDGLALWDEHKPQSGEDWVAVAERFIAGGGDTAKSSPLFAAVVLAVRQRDQARQEVLEEVRAEIEKRVAEQERRIGMSSRDTELRAMHGATILQNLVDYVTGLATLDPSGEGKGE